MPPTSSLSTDLVIKLLSAGCKTAPPNAAGKEAIRTQTIPNQPLPVSGGRLTLMIWVAARPSISDVILAWLYQGTGTWGVLDVRIKPSARQDRPSMTSQRSPYFLLQRPIKP